MDFGLAPAVRAALDDAMAHDLTGYVPPAAAAALTEAVCSYLTSHYGWSVAPEQVHTAGDVLSVLGDLLTVWTQPGAPVIVPTPAYMPFVSLPATYGHPIIQVPMHHGDGGWTLDLDDLDAAFANGGRVLILCNPHNPIGKVYTRDELGGIAEVVERHGGQVFADEIHAPLIYDTAATPHIPYASLTPATAAHTLTAFSASKAFNLPGLKCAQFVATNPDHIAWLQNHHFSGGAGTLGVIANTAAYRDGWDWFADVLSYLDGNRKLVAQLVHDQLPGVTMDVPDATYLAWLDVRALGLGDEPGAFFRDKAHVVMNEGSTCGEAGRGFVRLNFATSRPVLRQIVQQLADALR
jgi:cystathionine beta-lyase